MTRVGGGNAAIEHRGSNTRSSKFPLITAAIRWVNLRNRIQQLHFLTRAKNFTNLFNDAVGLSVCVCGGKDGYACDDSGGCVHDD